MSAGRKALDQMDRAELVAELRTFNPFGDYSGWDTAQLRRTLAKAAGVDRVDDATGQGRR